MQGSSVTAIIDFVTIVLLVATIGYSAMLHRRLGDVRKGRHELSGLIAELTGAAARAEAAISGLKAAANESARILENKLTRAQAARDELDIINSSGEKLAVRLEKGISLGRPVARDANPTPSISPALAEALAGPTVGGHTVGGATFAGASRSEQELFAAIKKAASGVR